MLLSFDILREEKDIPQDHRSPLKKPHGDVHLPVVRFQEGQEAHFRPFPLFQVVPQMSLPCEEKGLPTGSEFLAPSDVLFRPTVSSIFPCGFTWIVRGVDPFHPFNYFLKRYIRNLLRWHACSQLRVAKRLVPVSKERPLSRNPFNTQTQKDGSYLHT